MRCLFLGGVYLKVGRDKEFLNHCIIIFRVKKQNKRLDFHYIGAAAFIQVRCGTSTGFEPMAAALALQFSTI